jgi:hypothetical protein
VEEPLGGELLGSGAAVVLGTGADLGPNGVVLGPQRGGGVQRGWSSSSGSRVGEGLHMVVVVRCG